MEIFVRVRHENGAELSLTSAFVYWRHILYKTSFSLSRRRGDFADVWTHQMAQSNFEFETIFRLMYRYNILFSYVDSTDETRK